MFKKKYLNLLYIIFLGAISSYSLPPYNYFIINFISFSLFFIFIFNKKKESLNNRYFFKYGWLFGFGYFLFSLYWITISLTFDQSFHFLIPLAIIVVPAFLAIFYGLLTYLFSVFYSKNVLTSFFTFSVLFGIIEFIRGSVLTGFPWNLIAFSFVDTLHFIQIISIIGTYSFNLICISLFTAPALYILRKSKKEIIIISMFIFISLSFFLYGNLKIDKFYAKKNVNNSYTIRAISSNISLDRFYSEKDELKIIKELIKISSPKKLRPTIFIWPEGVISEENIIRTDVYKKLFNNNFSEDDFIILGLSSVENKNDNKLFFNSMAVLNNNLDLIFKYNKVDLVPFGEFTPFENVLNLIGFKTITNNYQSYTSGKIRVPLNIKNDKIDFKLLPLICYEIIYSGKLSKDKNFDYIINISEDGWFGNSVGPKQHFSHSIYRSIESGKYIIRSANNGISAIVNPTGNLEKQIKFGSIGYIDFLEARSIKPTIFSIYGNKIFIIFILLYIFLIFSFNRIENE